MLIGSKEDSIPEGPEAQMFQKTNKQIPTFALLQLKQVSGFTRYSPIWGNKTYKELAKLQQGSNRDQGGVLWE